MTNPEPEAICWSRSAAEVAAGFGGGPGGLASDRAATTLAQTGPNSVEDAPRPSALRFLSRQLESPLALILVVAAIISLTLRQWVDAGIILAIVLGSALSSVLQEYRASAAVAELKRRLALTARVLREGTERVVPMKDLVPGDVILLSAGNLVPADGLVLEAGDFLVTGASMTGEEIAAMRDEALRHAAPRTDLFVGIDPHQKERMVRALQRTGHSVGYLGDGINDAPALHAADMGISVAEAVDVARDSADIIPTSRDLDVLREGVAGGDGPSPTR